MGGLREMSWIGLKDNWRTIFWRGAGLTAPSTVYLEFYRPPKGIQREREAKPWRAPLFVRIFPE